MVHIHAHTHVHAHYSIDPAQHIEHGGMLDGEWTSTNECVGHESVDLKWSSSVVEWMCSSVQRNSTAALHEEETDNIPRSWRDQSDLSII